MRLETFHKLDVILICGIQGAGKSHFSREYFKDTNRKRINRSGIRKFLYEMTNFDEQWYDSKFDKSNEHLVKHVENKIYEHYMHKDEKVLIDNTSVTKKSREKYVSEAKKRGKSVGIIFLNTPVSKCLDRNKQKGENKVNPTIISNLYAQIELPKSEKAENADEIMIINNY